MSASGWQEIIGVAGVFVVVTAVLTVSIWQFAATWRAKAGLARENEYRKLAEKALLLQETNEQQLAEIGGQLAEVQSRLHSVERILKEVE